MGITNWLQKRREENEALQFKAGYNFAAGALLRAEETPFSLEVMQNSTRRNTFDQGMDSAIDALVNFGVIEDNRI